MRSGLMDRDTSSSPRTVTTGPGSNRDRPRADEQKLVAPHAKELSAGAWAAEGSRRLLTPLSGRISKPALSSSAMNIQRG